VAATQLTSDPNATITRSPVPAEITANTPPAEVFANLTAPRCARRRRPVLRLLRSLGRAPYAVRTRVDAPNGKAFLARDHGPPGLSRGCDRAPQRRHHLLLFRRFCRRSCPLSESSRALRLGAPCRFRQPIWSGSPLRSARGSSRLRACICCCATKRAGSNRRSAPMTTRFAAQGARLASIWRGRVGYQLQSEHLLLLAAEQRQDAVRRQFSQRLAEFEIVSELGAGLRVACANSRTETAARPHFFAQGPDQRGVFAETFCAAMAHEGTGARSRPVRGTQPTGGLNPWIILR
jgi:hypothetical protein